MGKIKYKVTVPAGNPHARKHLGHSAPDKKGQGGAARWESPALGVFVAGQPREVVLTDGQAKALKAKKFTVVKAAAKEA